MSEVACRFCSEQSDTRIIHDCRGAQKIERRIARLEASWNCQVFVSDEQRERIRDELAKPRSGKVTILNEAITWWRQYEEGIASQQARDGYVD